MRRALLFAAILGASAIIVTLLLFSVFSPIFAKDYALDVDPMKDSQNLFTTARVTISNSGKLPLTNVIVNYGGNNNNTNQKINLLPPGEKVFLSPPENTPLKAITVTTAQGLTVVKEYRTPIKLPGMMGS
jgi:hypothetical protein